MEIDKSWTKKDFKIDWFSGTGAGGQHRNKHQNCVRITHIESGLTTTGQNFRERSKNFEDAFKRLASKIVLWHYGEQNKDRINSEVKVRSYNECENRVIDHQSGKKFKFSDFSLEKVIKKNSIYPREIYEEEKIPFV